MENSNEHKLLPMMVLDILLATYNGGNFLENQLYSLIGQTDREWRLLIHDDGSTDNTLTIIKKFVQLDERIVFIEDGIVGLGAARNFLHLLNISNAEFMMFCDQDDIWFENKIAVLKNNMDNASPCAVYCNAYLYKNYTIQSDKVTFLHPKNLKNTLFFNSGIQGCSVMFNRRLKEQLNPLPDYVYMHDHLITLAAVTFGTIRYVNSSLMLYRKHDLNVTGQYETDFLRRVTNFFKRDKFVVDRRHYDSVACFFNAYKNKLSEDNQKLFQAYLKFGQSSIVLKRVLIILQNGFKIGNSRWILILKTIMRRPIN